MSFKVQIFMAMILILGGFIAGIIVTLISITIIINII